MRAPRDTSYEEALLPLLKDPQDAASHVETEMELDDPAALLVALHHVAKAHGMAEVARRPDVGNKSMLWGHRREAAWHASNHFSRRFHRPQVRRTGWMRRHEVAPPAARVGNLPIRIISSELIVEADVAEILVSADSHVLEPGNLWAERLDNGFRDRAPRIFQEPQTRRYQFGGGEIPVVNYAGLFAVNKRGEALAVHNDGPASEADAPPAGWDPHRGLEDMLVDGVWCEVLYGSLVFPMFRVQDPAFQLALFRVYNDWLAEFCAVAPDRFVGMALVSLIDVEAGVAELQRVRRKGLRGAMIFASPPPDRPFTTREYDPFWRVAQELGMPIGLHILTGHGAPSQRMIADLAPVEFLTGLMGLSDEVVYSLSDILFSGVLERFPNLKIVSAENEIGWLPFWVHMADQWWGRYKDSRKNELTMPPSAYYKRQIFATFLEDPVGVHCASLPQVGYDNLMWGNDYPHGSSTWPHSRKVIDRVLAGVSAANRAKLVRENCARLYDLKLPAATTPTSAAP